MFFFIYFAEFLLEKPHMIKSEVGKKKKKKDLVKRLQSILVVAELIWTAVEIWLIVVEGYGGN